jgi:hypothetical protein
MKKIAWLHTWMSKWDIRYLLVLRMEQMTYHQWWKGYCSVDVVHGGIPHVRACPAAEGAHNSGDQYSWPKGGGGVLELWSGWPSIGDDGQYPPKGSGGQYLPRSDSGSHIGGYPTAGNPLHAITGGGCKNWLILMKRTTYAPLCFIFILGDKRWLQDRVGL